MFLFIHAALFFCTWLREELKSSLIISGIKECPQGGREFFFTIFFFYPKHLKRVIMGVLSTGRPNDPYGHSNYQYLKCICGSKIVFWDPLKPHVIPGAPLEVLLRGGVVCQKFVYPFQPQSPCRKRALRVIYGGRKKLSRCLLM